jgi:uncharacterized protein YhaN
MRLLELELTAYGGFTGARLDLARRDALHVVYGANEAGKSTTLRAVHALLYGIDGRTGDAYRHGYADLRIGARVQSADGRELCFVRRKGSKGTLLGPAGQELADAALLPFLCAVDRPLFEAMFGLDHARLRAGGEQLRTGRGDVGESLFQAGAGAASIQRVLSSLRSRHEQIYTPRGKRQLNEALDAFEAARKRLRDDAVRADRVHENEEKVARLTRELETLAVRRRDLTAELSRLQRALHVLPGLRKREAYLHEQQELGAVPELPANAEQLRKELQQVLVDSGREIARLSDRAARLREEQGRLQIVASLEHESGELMRELQHELAVHRQASVDLPKRQAELRALEHELAVALGALPDGVGRDHVEQLRFDAAMLARIGKLGRERGALEARAEQAQAARDAAIAHAKRARSAALQSLVDPEQDGDVGSLAQEPVFEGLELRMPSEETIASYTARFERLEREAERLEGERESLAQRASRLAIQLDAFARSDAPPTDAELQAARAARDAGLRGLREAAVASRAAEVAAVDAAAQQVLHADQLGDRLRREAARVAQRAEWLAEQTAVEETRASLAERAAQHATRAQDLLLSWRALWSAVGIAPGTPQQMRARRTRLLEALAAAERLDAAERSHAAALDAVKRWQAQWAELMAKLDLPPGASGEEAQAVVDTRHEVLRREDQCRALRGRIEGMARNSAALRARAEAQIARHAPELASRSMEDAVDELLRLHARTREDVGQRARIVSDLRELDAQLEEARARNDAAQRGLSSLMQLAGVSSPEELERQERRTRRARELSELVLDCERDLIEHGDGLDLAQLEREVRGLDADRARARRDEIRAELEQLDEEQPRLLQEKVSVEGAFAVWRSHGAADAAAEVEQQLARVRDLALRYARQRLAAELLERAIQRYREHNQGPVLKRAEVLFARLTLGAYPRLQVAYDQRDEPVLQCLRGGERTVEVERLSEGTLDQLYFALRVASLERFAQSAEPMPLLLDDVLVNSDDDRARAAFEVLGELTQTMQVLYFTHHVHHLELARAALGPERVVEHRLSREQTSAASAAQR